MKFDVVIRRVEYREKPFRTRAADARGAELVALSLARTNGFQDAMASVRPYVVVSVTPVEQKVIPVVMSAEDMVREIAAQLRAGDVRAIEVIANHVLSGKVTYEGGVFTHVKDVNG